MPHCNDNIRVERREGARVTFRTYSFPNGIEDIDNVVVRIWVIDNRQDSAYEPTLIINKDRSDEWTINNGLVPAPDGRYRFPLTLEIPRADNENNEKGHTFYVGHTIDMQLIESMDHGRLEYAEIDYDYVGGSFKNYLKYNNQHLCKSISYEAVTVDLLNLSEGRIYYIDQADYDRVMIENNLFPPVPASNGKLRILLPQAMQYRADTTYDIGQYVLYRTLDDTGGGISVYSYHFYKRQQLPGAGDDPTDWRYWFKCPDNQPGITFYRPSGKGYLYIP